MTFSDIPPDRLLSIARDYWPVSKEEDPDIKYKDLTDLWDQQLKKHDQWHAFLRELRKDLPGFSFGDATATPDASCRCTVYSPIPYSADVEHFIVVGCKSILAPVYTVYGVEFKILNNRRQDDKVFLASLPAYMQHVADVVARKLEATFDVKALPRGVADTPVPLYIEPVEPPHTTLFHALFTSQPESLP